MKVVATEVDKGRCRSVSSKVIGSTTACKPMIICRDEKRSRDPSVGVKDRCTQQNDNCQELGRRHFSNQSSRTRWPDSTSASSAIARSQHWFAQQIDELARCSDSHREVGAIRIGKKRVKGCEIDAILSAALDDRLNLDAAAGLLPFYVLLELS